MDNSKKRSILVILIFTLFLTVDTIACSCREPRSVDKEFAAAKDVVIMKALAARAPRDREGSGDEMIKVMNFSVQKVFKGSMKPGQELEMTWTGMCDFGFYPRDIGEQFLFYYYNDMYFMVPPCTRSGLVKWRGADLKWIENRDNVIGLSRISGTISQYFDTAVVGEAVESNPLKSHSVRIIGNGRDMRLRTDENGVYEVYGLPAGQYAVTPEKLKGYIPTNSIGTRTSSVVLRAGDKGQAEADFDFRVDNTIRGKLFDVDGKPLANVPLELIPAHKPARKYFVKRDASNNDGSFEFKSIPPGTYVIVGNSKNEITAENPYPMFYSSGTDDRKSAVEITIGPGDLLEGLVVKAPRPVETVTISGLLLYADGTPASPATVRFVTGDGENRAPGDAYAYPDKEGRFKLKVLKQQGGFIYAYIVPNKWTFRDCTDRMKSPVTQASKGKDGFFESSRRDVDASSGLTELEIKFPFSLCRGR